jgi:hypothetical protein
MQAIVTDFDFADEVRSLLPDAIERYALTLRRGVGGLVFLENAHCKLRLRGVLGQRLQFSMYRKPPCGRCHYDVGLFLFARLGMGARGLMDVQAHWSERRNLRRGLDRCNSLIQNGFLDAPLHGDYAWVEHYRWVEALSEALLLRMERQGLHADRAVQVAIADLRRIREAGDHTWIADAWQLLGMGSAFPMPP